MRDFISKYNKNRKIIWIIVGICVIVYVLIHITSDFLKNTRLDNNTNTIIDTNKTYKTNYAVMSTEKISENKNSENISIIKEFFDYCNEKKVDEAYSLLSNDCKEVLYPTKEVFESKYFNINFAESKTYKLQLWMTDDIKYTYRIEIISDLLETGGTLNTKRIDYFTIMKNGEKQELNIAGFIEKNDINISNETDFAKINVLSEEAFIDHINLNIEVYNKTDKKMLLDKGKKGDSVYLVDTNNNSYASFLFENVDDELLIEKNMNRTFSLKFNKEFNEDVKIKSIAFKDIVLNYERADEKDNQSIVIELIEQ